VSREFERIAAIRELLHRERDDVLVGMGDDAAVLEVSQARQVLTVDVAVEGVHFRRDLCSLTDAGYRAVTAAASDLAAMGARGRASLLAIVVPQAVTDLELLELVRGAGEAADAVGAPVVGGNLSSGAELSITTTVVGELDGDPLRRSAARPGDGVYVTGVVGAASLGMHLLAAGSTVADRPQARPCVQRYLRPSAALVLGQRLLGHATACIDISDGLLQDLEHICESSGVGAEIQVDRLPLPEGGAELAQGLQLDLLALALAGGDDYELLFTAPASGTADELGTRIGRITHGSGVTALGADGATVEVAHRGYAHFG
jgi:thiamine-monophosphate kinase